MNPEQIKELIDQLLQTGEILATRTFEIAMKQVYVEVFQNFVGAFICLLAVILGVILYKKGTNAHHNDFLSGADVPGVIFGLLGGIFFWAPLAAAISRLMNPEWYAVQMLLESFLK